MLLHIMGDRSISLFSSLDTVLSLVITLSLFCHNDGWLLHTSILFYGGYAFFQVLKILKWIYLTFGYGRGCALGRNWWTASALDVVHPEAKKKEEEEDDDDEITELNEGQFISERVRLKARHLLKSFQPLLLFSSISKTFQWTLVLSWNVLRFYVFAVMDPQKAEGTC